MNSKADLPPHNYEAEQAILGSCLIDPKLIRWFQERNSYAMFHDLRNAQIFSALAGMDAKGLNPDEALVYSWFKESGGECDFGYLGSLRDTVDSTGNHEFWFEILEEKFRLRKKIELGHKLIQSAKDGDTEFLNSAQALSEQLENKLVNVIRSRGTQMKEVLDYLNSSWTGEGASVGLKTGFVDLDCKLGGMEKGNYVTIAGRPSMGKSTLALNILENLSVNKDIPTGFISVEMSERELNLRSLARFSGIPMMTVSNQKLNEGELEKLSAWVGKLLKVQLQIVRPKDSSIGSVKSVARILRETFKAECIAVDYIQLIRGTRHEGKTAEVTEVSNELKRLAVELDIPIIVLSQFNRDVEKQERRPRLSDFRDSGAIEQDSDKAIMLHCENELEEKDNLIPMKLIIAKNRGGAKGEVTLNFQKDLNRFESVNPFKSHAP